MKRSNFRGVNVGNGGRSILNVQRFTGVDYTSQKFLVNDGKAIDIMNYIYKDNKVQKRNGLTTIGKITPYTYVARTFGGGETNKAKTNTVNINGIWNFLAEDKKYHIVAHIGKLLYEIKYIEIDDQVEINPILYNNDDVQIGEKYYKSCYEYEDYRSQAFVGGNKLWFLGGNKFMIVRFTKERTIVEPVEESELCPIPTTTTAITYDYAKVSGRQSYDKVNMLTKWRKNMLLSGVGRDVPELGFPNNGWYKYTLDSPIISKGKIIGTLKQDMKDFLLTIESRNEDKNSKIDYIAVWVNESDLSRPADKGTYGDRFLLFKDETYPSDYEIEDLRNELPYKFVDGVREINYSESSAYTTDTITKAKEKGYCVGIVQQFNDENQNGVIYLFDDYTPIIDGASNITVKFPCYVDGFADQINKCRFGILFGNNNAKNRLFLSGNPEHPNFDWHSGNISSAFEQNKELINGNFGYFEDTSFMGYGETDNQIVGYSIVSNDKLLVLKDYSDKETSIYFRNPTLITAIDSSGNAITSISGNYLYQEEFSLSQSNNSVAGISPQAITSLNGDTLFISNDNQIVGLDLEGIVGDNQRVANTRSYYIDGYLKDKDLSKAWLWTNNKDLYLVLKDEIFMTNFELLSNGQYDWFRMDIPNITAIVEIAGVRYFGNATGELFRFNEEYQDRGKIYLLEGDSYITVDTDVITMNKSKISLLEKDKQYTLKVLDSDNNPLLYEFGTATTGDTSMFKIHNDYHYDTYLTINKPNEFYSKWYGNKDIYIKLNNESNFSRYRLEQLEDSDKFKLYNIDNQTYIKLSNINEFLIGYRADEEYEVVDVDYDNSTIRLKHNGYYLNFITQDDDNTVQLLKGTFRSFKNVEAYYITKPYLSNDLSFMKTIWNWTLTNDTNVESEIEVTYTRNDIPYMNSETLFNVSKEALGVSLNELDFFRLDFEKNIVPRTYTHSRILSSVKFICFGFRNNNNTNSVLSKMDIVYTRAYPSY